MCGGEFRPTLLQVDHRIPFRVGGDPAEWDDGTVMLLCAPDNRAKSWTCENCPNWETRDPNVCATCFWAHPDGNYTHIATQQQRRVTITWQGDEETKDFDELQLQASVLEESLQRYIKQRIREMLNEANDESAM